jgi:hypothetical protein
MGERIIVTGDREQETRATQILSLAMARMSEVASANLLAKSAIDEINMQSRAVISILRAGSRSMAMASCAGLDTPLEILSLVARNSFELYLRLKHILLSEENCREWRSEGVRDQIEVYEGILSLENAGGAVDEVTAEMARVEARAAELGLVKAKRIARVPSLAEETGLGSEYRAFYKVYSKLVHPSSLSVNSPRAVQAPMYRFTFVVNAQVYGWLLLETAGERFEIEAAESYARAALELDAQITKTVKSSGDEPLH